jgi:hypothetical protein
MLAPAAVTALTFVLNIVSNAVFIRMFGYQVGSSHPRAEAMATSHPPANVPGQHLSRPPLSLRPAA